MDKIFIIVVISLDMTLSPKILIVYYSHGGNTAYIAEILKTTLQADILVLKPQKEISQTGFLKFFWGGKQAIMKETPSLEPFQLDPHQYNVWILGSPIWAWTVTPPLRSFLHQTQPKQKKIALFCCSSGGEGKYFEKVKALIPENNFIGQMNFIEPLTTNPEESKKIAISWAKSFAF